MSVKKIMVVDDNPTDRSNLERIVSGAGCLVVSAIGGSEAVAKAKAEKPDLIFLDIVMPDMDGYAAARALQGDPATKDIPIVFVTTKSQQADKVWAQMQGGKDLVAKPFTQDQILDQIRKAA